MEPEMFGAESDGYTGPEGPPPVYADPGGPPNGMDTADLGVDPVASELPESLLQANASNFSVEFIADKYEEFAQGLYDNGDPRSRDLPLMGKMDLAVGLTVCYLVVVWLGPLVMRNRAPMQLPTTMLVYNVLMVAWSSWIFFELLINSQLAGYNYFCVPYTLSYAPEELRIVRAMWMYYVSKFVEFLDTVFMILRKKQQQVTFLHVYHHAVMVPLWYIVMIDGPCCQAVLSALLNSGVHIVMYAYYALALFPRLHPYLWWKKYLTQLQLAQFVGIITTSSFALLSGCGYPAWLLQLNVAFVASLILLFARFYLAAYTRRAPSPPPALLPTGRRNPPPVLHLRPKSE